MEEVQAVIKFVAPFLGSIFGLLGGALAYRIKSIVTDQTKELKCDIDKKLESEKREREKTHEIIFDKIETVQGTVIDLCKQLARHDERINTLKEVAEKCEKRK